MKNRTAQILATPNTIERNHSGGTVSCIVAKFSKRNMIFQQIGVSIIFAGKIFDDDERCASLAIGTDCQWTWLD